LARLGERINPSQVKDKGDRVMDELKTNVLYFGDNLEILCKYIPDKSIDLIYLDPPFNSKKDYNILFKENGGVESEAQIKAFTDTWHWTQTAADTYHEVVTKGPLKVAQLIGALHDAIGGNDVMAYLVMMTARLVELHRVLKPTGSLYLHCDPTASHYLKLVLDQIFGPANFRNEIVWSYKTGGTSKRWFARKHETIFFYTKSSEYNFNVQYYKSWQRKKYNYSDKYPEYYDEEEKRWYHLAVCRNVWDDILVIGTEPDKSERLGYETQKPLALLERIIRASSNEGDIVLDPFCGCGTALVAAQKLNRRWIGIDITHLAVALMEHRLYDSFSIEAEVIGVPKDVASARALSLQKPDGRYQFQWWALSLIKARPLGEKKKGADKGIDGVVHFIDEVSGKHKRVVVQVKSGHVGVNAVRELKAVAANDAIGVLITLESPTSPMKVEAVEGGYYHSPIWDKDYPKLQILTIEELLQGKMVDMPPQTQTSVTFAKAPRVAQEEGKQLPMS
jgi:site-specific DNA-methyltransferase (adenine-specific)